MACCGIYKHVVVWEWEGVLGAGLIEVNEVDAHSPLTIFLSDNNNIS